MELAFSSTTSSKGDSSIAGVASSQLLQSATLDAVDRASDAAVADPGEPAVTSSTAAANALSTCSSTSLSSSHPASATGSSSVSSFSATIHTSGRARCTSIVRRSQFSRAYGTP
ncbi:hypothetical protein M3J09_007519 [Ascochyta lentis]